MKKLLLLGLAFGAVNVHADTLFNNGSPLNAPGWSYLAAPYSGLGFRANLSSPVADDFTVTGDAPWRVTSLDLYAFQFGATAFGFTSVAWSIISGPLKTGSVVASGVSQAIDGGLVGYRSTAGAPNMNRPIYDVRAEIPEVVLEAGTYWLTWGIDNDPEFGPAQVVPTGDGRVPGSAYQYNFGSWQALMDSAGAPPDLSFAINGSTVAAVPEPATTAMMVLGLGLLAGVSRRAASRRQRDL